MIIRVKEKGLNKEKQKEQREEERHEQGKEKNAEESKGFGERKSIGACLNSVLRWR